LAVLKNEKSYLSDPTVQSNVTKMVASVVDLLYLGFLRQNEHLIYDFITGLLEIFPSSEQDALSKLSRVDSSVGQLYRQFNRVVVYFMQNCKSSSDVQVKLNFISKCIYDQKTILNAANADTDFFRYLCYIFFHCISHDSTEVRTSAMNFWKLMLLQKPTQITSILEAANTTEQKYVSM
jgi:hypothetical protein